MSAQKLLFSVEGHPQPKPRMTQKDKYEPSIQVQRYWSWKKLVQFTIKQATNGAFQRMTGPVKVTAYFRIDIPNSWSKRKKQDAELRMILPIGHQAGDYDNYLKGIKDAMNDVVYNDDAQVIGVGEGYMYYSYDPGCSVIVQEIEPPLILPWDTAAAM